MSHSKILNNDITKLVAGIAIIGGLLLIPISNVLFNNYLSVNQHEELIGINGYGDAHYERLEKLMEDSKLFNNKSFIKEFEEATLLALQDNKLSVSESNRLNKKFISLKSQDSKPS